MSNDAGWTEVGSKEADEGGFDYKFFSLKAVGDEFIGKLLEVKDNIPSRFTNDDGSPRPPETHYVFARPDGKFGINPNADLKKRLAVVPLQSLVKIIVAGEKDIGKKSPMRVHRVLVKNEAAKPSAALPF